MQSSQTAELLAESPVEWQRRRQGPWESIPQMQVAAPKVSVIIPVYNQLPFVLKLCSSILRNPQPSLLEVILIDDASTEFDLNQLVGPPMTVIRNPVNMQFVKTVNAGASAARGEWLLFLNSDIEVLPNWLEPMVRLFESPPSDLVHRQQAVGVVGPRLLFPPNAEGKFTIQSAGGLYDVGKGPFHRFLGWDADDPRVTKTERVQWVTGAAFLTPRELFYRVGGFDEAYGRGYFEEVDYCERVKALGYTVWYCPGSTMIHYTGQSMAAASKTPDQIKAATKSFRENSWRFHAAHDANIKPDTQLQWVSY